MLGKGIHAIGKILIVLFFVQSCTLETAVPFKQQRVVLASDCLYQKDTVLFRSFLKQNGVSVQIVHMHADSIYAKLLSEGINTEIDAVILHSAYDMYRLAEKEALQTLSKERTPETLPSKHLSKKRTWMAIGIDPYVIKLKSDTLQKVYTYNELSKQVVWSTNIDTRAEWIPFYAAIYRRMNPKKKYNAYDWIQDFDKNKQLLKKSNDSTSGNNVLLTSYSSCFKDSLLLRSDYKKSPVIFPNQRSGGTYYNSICFGIVKQARNYLNAIALMQFISKERINQYMNNAWKTFPVIHENESRFAYQNVRFKKYIYASPALADFYGTVEKLLLKIAD